MATPLRLLICEDEEDDYLLTLRVLERGGLAARCTRVADPESMRAALRRETWDAIVSDYAMPGFGAEIALGVLKESGLDLPFIVVSGTISEEDAVGLLKAGANDFVSKNRMARLIPAIEREVADAGERRRRAEAEAALRESEERFRLLADHAPVLVWLADPGKGFTYVNRQWLDFTGRPLAAELGDGWSALVHPEDQPDCSAAYRDAWRTRAAFRREFRLRRHDGAWRWLLAHGVPRRFADGGFAGFVGSCVDISERKDAELALERQAAELRASNADLERFAYISSHDLQEPLRMVSSYLDLLRHRYGPLFDERAHEYLRYAIDGSVRMQQLLRDLLEYSRAGRDGDRPTHPVSLDEVLDQALARLQPAIAQSGARIERGPLPQVWVAADQVAIVLANLIGNAITYRGESSPSIRVTAEDAGRAWRIAVIDNGIGIDPAYQDRIFDLFQRLDRQVSKGTGLGLAICRRIVERWGGQLTVVSAPGAGSTFTFTVAKEPGPAVGEGRGAG